MSASGGALPAPRGIHLPRIRVKFKRPRWPKGSRFWLALTVAEAAWSIYLILKIARDPNNVVSLVGLGISLMLTFLYGWFWWLSRDDDDGPNTT